MQYFSCIVKPHQEDMITLNNPRILLHTLCYPVKNTYILNFHVYYCNDLYSSKQFITKPYDTFNHHTDSWICKINLNLWYIFESYVRDFKSCTLFEFPDIRFGNSLKVAKPHRQCSGLYASGVLLTACWRSARVDCVWGRSCNTGKTWKFPSRCRSHSYLPRNERKKGFYVCLQRPQKIVYHGNTIVMISVSFSFQTLVSYSDKTLFPLMYNFL